MKSFLIDYGTSKEEIDANSLDEACNYALDHCGYTGHDIVIYENNEEVRRFVWHGVPPNEDSIIENDFDSWGFYGCKDYKQEVIHYY